MFNDYSWYDGNIYSAKIETIDNEEYFADISYYVEDKIDLSKMIIDISYYK